jgi:phage portal protein BeeE
VGLWASITEWVQRQLSPQQVLFASGGAVTPQYDQISAMSTMARFPWIWTAAQAKTSDLAGLPLIAFERSGTTRRQSRVLVDDPVLELLRNPNAGTTGWLFLKQSLLDYEITRNAYWYRPTPTSIFRLHPACTRAIPGDWGIPLGYEYRSTRTGQTQILQASQVTHIRDVSWADDATEIYGESPIRCLHDDLVTDLGARDTNAKVAAKGRPDVLFSVKGMTGMGEKKTDDLIRRWERAIAERHGAFVVGGEVTASLLSWTPKDINDLPRAQSLRDMTLAVFGVPPTRAGLTTANYGASRQEMRSYWENLISQARAFESAISTLARTGVQIEFDFSAVEALQASYTERLMRVATWVGMGASPRAAAEYELFDGAPVPEEPQVDSFHSPRPIDRQPAEAGADRQPPAKAIESALVAQLELARSAYEAVDGDEVDTAVLTRWQTERLFAGLERAGVLGAEARVWAEEIAGVTDEMVRMGHRERAFTPERAVKLAERIAAITTREAA